MWPNKPVDAEIKDKKDVKLDADGKPIVEKSPAELIADALAPFTENMNKRFDAIDQRVTAVADQTKRPATTVAAADKVSVFDDEDAAFSQRMTPLLSRQLELESRVVKDQVRREYVDAGFGDMWQQYQKEVDGILDGSALVQADGQGGFKALRGDPQYIRNVVDMVFGRAARASGMRFDGKNKTFFLESTGGGADSSHVAAAEEGLSTDQLKVFKRMGIPLDEAKKTMAKLKFIN